MNELPKISIVTPSLNCAHMIKRCIDGVLAQNYPNFEHIVIDGGSTDGTLDLLRTYSHLQWISEPDKGEADALNKGFERATGELVNWLNADDQLIGRDVFSMVANEAQEHPECDVFYGRGVAIDEDGKVAWYRMPVHPLTLRSIMQWTYDLNVCQPAMFFRNKAIKATLPIPPEMKYGIDNCIWLRMAANQNKFHFINRPLAYACLVRKGAKSSASIEDQITGIHNVTTEFDPQLSEAERTTFWRDFYRYRLLHRGIYTTGIQLSDKKEELIGFTIAALESGELDLAIQGVERLSAVFPNHHDGFWLMSEILNKKGMHAESLQAIEHAARLLGAEPPAKS